MISILYASTITLMIVIMIPLDYSESFSTMGLGVTYPSLRNCSPRRLFSFDTTGTSPSRSTQLQISLNNKEENIFLDDEDFFLSINKKKEENTNWLGGGVPRSSLKPGEVAPLLMEALEKNNFPNDDAGLITMWEFSTDVTKFIFKNNITEFIESCHETAEEFPTSFYGIALYGQSWELESEINLVGGENGWIATQVMKTISSDGRMRRWQWEFRKNKRPPCLGCWKVENIASSDRKGHFQTEGRGTGWED